MKQVNISRRKFISGAAMGVAVAGMPQWALEEALAASPTKRRKIGPNDTIQMAVIGPGGSKGGFKMGLNIARAAASKPGVKMVAACDVDEVHAAEAVRSFGNDCKGYADFRDVIARNDIDAVVIGTPDHWHAYIAIAAMKAGKDVYCEKPLTLTIHQGKEIVKWWKRTGAVFQTGSQQRSDGNFRLACELVRNGRLGKITRVEVRLPGGPAEGPFNTEPVPEGFNWDMWLGPAPMTEYVRQRTHGSFRWWREYSGGMLTDWGAHHNDIMQWGLGYDRSGPTTIEGSASGVKICKNCYNTYPNFDLLLTYADGTPVKMANQGENGVKFEGENGWIFVSRGKLEASDKALLEEPLPDNASRLYVSNDHVGNWVDGIRTRKQPICDAEIGHRSVSVCHLANIALDLGGGKLMWDPAKEEFVGNAEANKRLKREERTPFRV